MPYSSGKCVHFSRITSRVITFTSVITYYILQNDDCFPIATNVLLFRVSTFDAWTSNVLPLADFGLTIAKPSQVSKLLDKDVQGTKEAGIEKHTFSASMPVMRISRANAA